MFFNVLCVCVFFIFVLDVLCMCSLFVFWVSSFVLNLRFEYLVSFFVRQVVFDMFGVCVLICGNQGRANSAENYSIPPTLWVTCIPIPHLKHPHLQPKPSIDALLHPQLP